MTSRYILVTSFSLKSLETLQQFNTSKEAGGHYYSFFLGASDAILASRDFTGIHPPESHPGQDTCPCFCSFPFGLFHHPHTCPVECEGHMDLCMVEKYSLTLLWRKLSYRSPRHAYWLWNIMHCLGLPRSIVVGKHIPW